LLDLTVGPSGVLRHTPEIITKFYLPYPGGAFIVVMLFAGAMVSILGPIGVFLGLRYVWSGRGLENRALGMVLMLIPIALSVSGSIAGFLVGPPNFGVSFDNALLFVVLPVLGIAHLLYLARRDGMPAAVARVPAFSG
jgi:hypothetical protein